MKPKPSDDPAALRLAAEARLKEKPATHPPQNEADFRRIQHELEVHQIELEMQNEELVEARVEIEAGLEHFTDLYDFAPVGYLTLDRDGKILAANLTVASLLGVERGLLLGRSWRSQLSEADRPAFDDFLEQTFSGGVLKFCEGAIAGDRSDPLFVRIEWALAVGGKECRVAVLDVTDRRQAEVERDKVIEELQVALAQVKQLSGLLPICCSCKKIRDENESWSPLETYLSGHTGVTFNHSFCPACESRTLKELDYWIPTVPPSGSGGS